MERVGARGPGAVLEVGPPEAAYVEGRAGSSTRGRVVEGCARVSAPTVGMVGMPESLILEVSEETAFNVWLMLLF
jgi:hypothetical protein